MVATKSWLEMSNIDLILNNHKILSNISLNIKYGENTVILGPNGSGKSSLIKIINRNLYPIIKKDSYLKLFSKSTINIWDLRLKVGFVLNELQNRISIYEKVNSVILSGFFGTTGIFKYTKVTDSHLERVERVKTDLNISDISMKYYGELSEGQKRIILIARALVNNPEILVMDEPTYNLDYKAKYLLLDILSYLAQNNTTLLIVTHQPEDIIKEISKIIMLKSGSIYFDGTKKDAMSPQVISNLFDYPLELLIDHKSFFHIVPK